MKGYKIIPKEAGTFIVINLLNGNEYLVDIYTPYCRCKAWKYTKKKRGIKKICKHISMCRGIISRKYVYIHIPQDHLGLSIDYSFNDYFGIT